VDDISEFALCETHSGLGGASCAFLSGESVTAASIPTKLCLTIKVSKYAH